jgi:hypothetical protein
MIERLTTNGSVRGVALTDKYKKKASTVIAANTVLALDSAGELIPATTTTPRIAAITRGSVAATDSDYATNSVFRVDQINHDDEFLIDVDDASTAGFVAGVTRALLNAGTVKAAAPASGNEALVIIKKVFVADNKAIVSFKPLTSNEIPA